MTKICHMADIHWRSLSRHDEYRAAFENAFLKLRALKPDIIFIAGDIVHSKTQGISPELISNLTWWFNGLAEIADVHVTLGNHDGLILNPDREDAISPILAAIDNPRIKLYKKSGTYPMNDECNICVYSCFDEAGWPNVKPEDGKINIATFHGVVHSSETDAAWALESDVNVKFFAGFDFVMLGDIHKQQSLDAAGRIKYAGSTIQQNYAESQGKGFLTWDIRSKDDFDVTHVEIKHEHPFVTLDYDDDLDKLQSEMEEYPSSSHVRVKIQSGATQADMSQIRAAIKNVAGPTEIVFKREVDPATLELSDELLDETIKLDSFEAVNNLINEFYANAKLDEETINEMAKTLSGIWKSARLTDNSMSGRWSLRRLEFDNIFGYGEGNIVNFESATGITGIFGKNRSGKSSLCGAATYALFNGTDRGAMKNMHIVNARKGYCTAKALISKKGKNYIVERQTVKKTTKKGDSHAVTHLNLFESDETGTPLKDISEEQRRETEKTLRGLVGTLDDFLLTTLASQGDINRFVDQGSATRKSILAKFLRLDILDTLFELVKQDLSVAKKMLKSAPEQQFDAKIVDKNAKVKARTAERAAESDSLGKITRILNNINSALDSQTTEMYVQSEIDDQIEKIKDANESRTAFLETKTVAALERDVINTTIAEMKSKIQDIDFAKLKKKKVAIVDSEHGLITAAGEIETKSSKLRADQRAVKKLSDVPCGDTFPQCKYIISAKKAEKSMLEKKDDLLTLKKNVASLKSSLKKLLKENVDEKLAQKQEHDEKLFLLTQKKSKLNMQILGLESRISNVDRDLAIDNSMLSRMKINLCSTESAKERKVLVAKKKLATEKLQESKLRIQTLSERIGLLTSEVKRLRTDKIQFEKNNQQVQILTLLGKALNKNGIPLQIVKRKLPVINVEIANILQGITGFTVELTVDESAGMDIILNYGDSKRVIECCSGMEKMMSSLAIRTALVRVSSLPKADVLIIDEGFGALDATNVEACTTLLRSLTKTFRLILIISHVDTVKDVVDNIIEISTTKGHDAQVKFL